MSATTTLATRRSAAVAVGAAMAMVLWEITEKVRHPDSHLGLLPLTADSIFRLAIWLVPVVVAALFAYWRVSRRPQTSSFTLAVLSTVIGLAAGIGVFFGVGFTAAGHVPPTCTSPIS